MPFSPLALALFLAGWDKNLPDGTVRFLLQGHRSRLDRALAGIPTGDPKARVDGISTEQVPAASDLGSFVVRGWTSKSRGYEGPTDRRENEFPSRDHIDVMGSEPPPFFFCLTGGRSIIMVRPLREHVPLYRQDKKSGRI